MLTIALPPLAGTRDAADRLLNGALTGHDSLHTEQVVLLCRDVDSVSASFADQLVARLLEQGKAAELIMVAPSRRLDQLVRKSAANRGVADRVRVDTATALGV